MGQSSKNREILLQIVLKRSKNEVSSWDFRRFLEIQKTHLHGTHTYVGQNGISKCNTLTWDVPGKCVTTVVGSLILILALYVETNGQHKVLFIGRVLFICENISFFLRTLSRSYVTDCSKTRRRGSGSRMQIFTFLSLQINFAVT